MRRSQVAAALVALMTSTAAGAQPRPAGQPGATPPTTTPTPPITAPTELPPTPKIDDPMLAPIAKASIEIANWNDALKYVRARSTDLRIAVDQVIRAEGQSRVALAGALPQITANGIYTHNLITREAATLLPGQGTQSFRTPFPDFATGNVSVNQPIIAPRTWYAIGTAHLNEDVARMSVEDAKRLISLNVANAIVGVVTAERVAELNRVALFNALARLDLAQRKTALGSGTGLDIVRAKKDVETTRAILVAGDETLRQAREALGLALGVPTQIGVPSNVDLNGLEASARGSCKPTNNVDDRPDVAALRGRVELAERAHNDVKYQFSPTVDMRSNLGSTTIAVGNTPPTTWNVQAVLTIPLWDGGARYGNLRDTAAQQSIAEQTLEAQRRKANIEVTQARRAVTVAEDRRKVALQTRDLAAEDDRLTRAAYVEGRGTSLELVTAAQALRQAEIELALRDFDLVKARIGAVLALATCPW